MRTIFIMFNYRKRWAIRNGAAEKIKGRHESPPLHYGTTQVPFTIRSLFLLLQIF